LADPSDISKSVLVKLVENADGERVLVASTAPPGPFARIDITMSAVVEFPTFIVRYPPPKSTGEPPVLMYQLVVWFVSIWVCAPVWSVYK